MFSFIFRRFKKEIRQKYGILLDFELSDEIEVKKHPYGCLMSIGFILETELKIFLIIIGIFIICSK